MDCHGRMLAHVLLHESDGILSMSWNYPIFLVEDSSESDTDSDDYSPPQGNQLAALTLTAFRKENIRKEDDITQRRRFTLHTLTDLPESF